MLRTRTRSDLSASFLRQARGHRLPKKASGVLEHAARTLFGGSAERVFSSREDFEAAAAFAVIGEAGNLELSYGRVDALATALERLKLVRQSDIPDPFRRVWIYGPEGERKRGVVLRREDNAIAVFCPPSRDEFISTGCSLFVEYRGFDEGTRFELQLLDSVLLPEALVLHLVRPSAGAIGRSQERVDIQFAGTLRVAPEGAVGEVPPADLTLWPAQILDISSGGVRIASEIPEANGRELELEFALPDDPGGPVRMPAVLRWNRVDERGRRTQGLQFAEAEPEDQRRYLRFLSRFLEIEEPAPSATPQPEAASAPPQTAGRESDPDREQEASGEQEATQEPDFHKATDRSESLGEPLVDQAEPLDGLEFSGGLSELGLAGIAELDSTQESEPLEDSPRASLTDDLWAGYQAQPAEPESTFVEESSRSWTRAALAAELEAVRLATLEVEVQLLQRVRDHEPMTDVLVAEREALPGLLADLTRRMGEFAND